MRYILFLIFTIIPGVSYASSGWEGLIGTGAIRMLLLLWPIILPFFFLPKNKKRFAHYLILIILVYGILGLASAPFSFLLQAGSWFNSSFYGWGYVLATQALAFCLSIYVLRQFSVLCIKAVDDYYTQH